MRSAGDELEVPDEPYGWTTSQDVGYVFTDGFNVVGVTREATGPIRLVSATPIMDDGPALRVLGVRVQQRYDPSQHFFQRFDGFPPNDPPTTDSQSVEIGHGFFAHPLRPVRGFEIPVPAPHKSGDFNNSVALAIGYEVVAEGRSARRGIELIYEYRSDLRRAFIPSYLAVCAPATSNCAPEYPSSAVQP